MISVPSFLYCERIALRYAAICEYRCNQRLGLAEDDSDKDETEKENGHIHDNFFAKETFFFERGDYEHAADSFLIPAHIESCNTDKEKKSEIVSKYRLQSRIYRDRNNDSKAKLYEERADEIERNFDNRKNIFEELFSDFEEKPV